MGRYIVNFARVPSKDELGSVISSDKVHVVDTSRKMMLLEGEQEDVRKLAAAIPDAIVVPEKHFQAGPDQSKIRLKLKR